jgi:glutaredoxin 3
LILLLRFSSFSLFGFFFTMAILRTDISAVVAALLLVLSSSSCHAFHCPSKAVFAARTVNKETGTQANLFGFLNTGKKALVKKLAGDYDSAAIRARLDGLIQDNPVLMLSFTTWPFCVKAKEVLKSAKYTVVELDTDPEGKAIRAELGELVGRTSVPAIWIDGEFIGGCNDGPTGGLVKLQEEGKLNIMLKGVGAI